MAESARVQETSYIMETNPETASVSKTNLSAVRLGGNEGSDASFPSCRNRGDERSAPSPPSQRAKRPIATFTAAIINVVLVFPIPGISTKAANKDPAAAPKVFSA